MKVTVYTKSNCVQCEQTKKQFDKFGIVYDVVDLEQNPLIVDGFREQGLLAAPIVKTDTTSWSGFRLDKITGLVNHIKSISKGETE